jgi:hypothetical protein
VLTIPFVLFVEMNCKRNRHMATLGEINVAQTGHGPWKGIVLFGFFLVQKDRLSRGSMHFSNERN